MKTFENLNESQQDALLKFPAYITLLAANGDGKLDKSEKEDSKHYAHIKTFSCDPMLTTFYEKADNVFETNIESLNNSLPKEKSERDGSIRSALENLEPILDKMSHEYAVALHESMRKFAAHVSRAHNHVALQFLLPVYISGISE